tara:strand:- start:5894 stop:6958 length:1065 start_codon:yes stop_codon:yes gene_type:complete
MRKKILISTGGSGGHVIPAQVLHEHLSKDVDIVISTDKRGSKYLDKKSYNSKIINTPKLNNIFFLPINILIILYLTIKSIFLLKRENIEKVISTGGYMSLPLILASKFLKLNIYLIEPNFVLGRANKYFLNSCKNIICYTDKIKNFPEKFRKKIVIINPLIKKEFYKIKRNSRNDKILNLLIVGGSQGASVFDNDLKKIILNISKKVPIKIFQQTSEKKINELTNFYSKNNIENKIFSFNEDFINIIKQADLCITRAGASTLAELSVLNIPFLAVPLPSSKDNHQYENAKFYEYKDCCWILDQKFFYERIEGILIEIIEEKEEYLKKIDNLKKLNYQNTWINVNQKILSIINEN